MRIYAPTYYSGSIGVGCDECNTVVTVARWDTEQKRCSTCGKLMPTHSVAAKEMVKEIQGRRPDLKSIVDMLQTSLMSVDDSL